MSNDERLRVLLGRAREGDDTAFSELVKVTQFLVFRTCAALGSNDAAEDLVQETYLKVWKMRAAYRGESGVQTWILGIARHTCIDHVRRSMRQRRLLGRIAASMTSSTEASSPDWLPPEYRDLLSATSPENAEAFMLTQFVGLSYAEAGSVVGCPAGTIRSRVSRARSALHFAYRASETG
ncbi:MAG: RNA polymerase sigma factor [Actinomycetota bacterium]